MLKPVQGDPIEQGLYVAYIESMVWHDVVNTILLMWYAGRWRYQNSDQNYRGHVHGWIGPLEIMKLG